jgi:hypothetical protein
MHTCHTAKLTVTGQQLQQLAVGVHTVVDMLIEASMALATLAAAAVMLLRMLVLLQHCVRGQLQQRYCYTSLLALVLCMFSHMSCTRSG